MQHTVVSVTVTKNGKSFLDRHLESLEGQSRRLDEIIVVDNASSDDTIAFVAERWPSITVIRLPSNEGVAGGYSAGIKYALDRNYDWVWMLDQDSVPFPGTLRKLIDTYDSLPNREQVGLVAPIPVDEGSNEPALPFRWTKGKQVSVKPVSFDQGVTFVDMVISSGSLVRADAVRKAGLPRSEFFMDFVDFEHCLRLRRHGFLVAVVNDCTMLHKIGTPRSIRILGRKIMWTTHIPWRGYYKVRNRTYVAWHEMPSTGAKCFVLKKLFAQALGTLLFDSDKFVRMNFMWRGFWDGIQGKLGIQVAPID